MTPYKYKFLKIEYEQPPFEDVTDYLLETPCQGQAAMIEYIFRLYRFRNLYISDIFPAMYEGQSNCFKRFTSHEGYQINYQQLSVNCLNIFVSHYISQNPDNVLVVSGSYQEGEDTGAASRKLRLYWYMFRDAVAAHKLRTVKLFEQNAFFVLGGGSTLSDEQICGQYADFKAAKKSLG